jgi:5-methylcytosine-specific restriction endonuclease McrA
VGKNLYERRKARAAKPVPPAKYRELELLVIKRAAMFCEEYMATDGWSRMCERKALLLNSSVEHLLSRKSDTSTAQETSAGLCWECSKPATHRESDTTASCDEHWMNRRTREIGQ